MTVVALPISLNMARVLAARRGPVVATGAGARDRAVVEAHVGPTGGDVTVLADVAGRDMARVLAARRGPVVATGASAGRSLECPPDMAFGTVDAHMRTRQWKSKLDMFRDLIRLSGSLGIGERGKGKQKYPHPQECGEEMPQNGKKPETLQLAEMV